MSFAYSIDIQYPKLIPKAKNMFFLFLLIVSEGTKKFKISDWMSHMSHGERGFRHSISRPSHTCDEITVTQNIKWLVALLKLSKHTGLSTDLCRN